MRVTPQGQQVVVRFVNPGDTYGIAKADYPATALALVDSVTLLWPDAIQDAFVPSRLRWQCRAGDGAAPWRGA